MNLTESELLDAIRAAAPTHGQIADGMTVPQMARILGCSETRTRKLVRKLLESGTLAPCQVVVTAMSGRELPVTGYRLT